MCYLLNTPSFCSVFRQVTFPGHEVLTETFNVPHGPDNYSALTHDFLLRRSLSPTGESLGAGGGATRVAWTGPTVGLSLALGLRSLID